MRRASPLSGRLLEDYPSVFAQVKQRAKEGRFIPMGGTWVEMVRMSRTH